MLDLSRLDVDEIATALSDQTDYEHRWLIDPRTGQVAFWTSDTGIDGERPVDLDELDLIPIDPLPSFVWYQDMADFAEGTSEAPPRTAKGGGSAGGVTSAVLGFSVVHDGRVAVEVCHGDAAGDDERHP